MAGLPTQQAVPQAQFPQPNAMQKQDMGVMPDPLTSALNAFLTQMSGTNYDMNQAATSFGPPRVMPGGMQMNVPPPPPVPEANPAFHPSPIQYDLGALFRSAEPVDPSIFDMKAMGDESMLPPPAQPAATPPVPAKKASNSPSKPKRVEKKPEPNGKPQPYKGKGAPSTEPKRVAPPAKKKMIAEK